jgi:UDP-N-acetylglucosamine 2-epimerase (non-hydrolysing)
MKKTILSIFGTRPEASKMAPLVLALQKAEGLCGVCCVTAQHREMLDDVLAVFGIVPEYDLNVMQHRQSPSQVAARILEGLGPVFDAVRPDMVLVHGDTTTTMASALAAAYHGIPVGHVEAGLRTFDKKSPFPEELNRLIVAPIADLHFCPTERNRANLEREGIIRGVHVTGNTAIDCVRLIAKPDYRFATESLNGLTGTGRRLVYFGAHRRENYGRPFANLFAALRRLAADFPDTDFIFPRHPSPVVRDSSECLRGIPNVHLLEPLPLQDNINLFARCALVMTDSGGLQEEVPALGIPVLVLRRETERPEAVEAGTVALAGIEEDTVYAMAARLLTDPAARAKMAKAVSPYGDGYAAEKIRHVISAHFTK